MSNKLYFEVGKKYLIRGVLYYVGEVSEVTDQYVVLQNASWVADTGYFADCLKNGTFNESAPYVNPVMVPIRNMFDATLWQHALPGQ